MSKFFLSKENLRLEPSPASRLRNLCGTYRGPGKKGTGLAGKRGRACEVLAGLLKGDEMLVLL